MSQEQSSGCFKAFMICCLLNVLLIGAISAGGYTLWKKSGSPSLEKIQAFAEEQQGVQLGSASSEGLAGAGHGTTSQGVATASRPIVATAPIQGSTANYQTFTARKDVMTLVNYYSDT